MLAARREDRLKELIAAIAYAIEQPGEVDVNEIIIRPTIRNFRLKIHYKSSFSRS
jgi:hypothetical protein